MTIVLPIGSILPERDPTLRFGAVTRAIDAALNVLVGATSEAADVAQALNALAAVVRAQTLAPLDIPSDAAAQREALLAAAPRRLSDEELANFAIYDDYFGVVRARLDAPSYARELLAAWAAGLADLSRALVGRDEVAALLRAFRGMLARIGDAEASTADVAPAAVEVTPQPPVVDAQGVPSRWHLGHYLFALAAIHGRDAFAHMLDMGASVDAPLAVAATMARAMAAAQWYASEFPIDVYLRVVRPTMERSGARGGFSGTQNADYRCREWMRERAIEGLFERFGTTASAWPAPTYAALTNLREMEIEAAEHHVLIAASKVRLDGSLAQKAQGDPLPAVTALREKAVAVADDLTGRFIAAPLARRVRACAIADVPAERPLAVTLEGKDLAIVRAHGALWACDGICTHAGGELCEGHLAGNALVCPLHGAEFDPRTGAVLRPPATQPLATYLVTIEGADVYVDMT